MAVMGIDVGSGHGHVHRSACLEAAVKYVHRLAMLAAMQWWAPVTAWIRREGEGANIPTERGGWRGARGMQVTVSDEDTTGS